MQVETCAQQNTIRETIRGRAPYWKQHELL